MPSFTQTGPQAFSPQQYVNHSRTISDAKKGVTYVGQENLKKLPIPTLEETCQMYLDSVRPFLTERELADTKHVVQDFKEREGPGLQRRLIKYAENKPSYIEQFCTSSIDA